MKRIAQLVALSAVLAWPLMTHAQQKPNFSGTWTMDVAQSESTKQDATSAVSPVTLVINQNDRELQIETMRDGNEAIAKYPIENTLDPRPVGTSGNLGIGSILRWEDDGALVTLTPHEINGMAVTTVERRTLSADGNEMTVVSTIQVQHGYQDGVNYSAPARDVYHRVRH